MRTMPRLGLAIMVAVTATLGLNGTASASNAQTVGCTQVFLD
ncbi:MAG: hypothetical protein ACT4N7_18170 [Actinokineospora sp.]